MQAIPIDEEVTGELTAITQWSHPDSAYYDIQMKVYETLEMLKSGTYPWKTIPKS